MTLKLSAKPCAWYLQKVVRRPVRFLLLLGTHIFPVRKDKEFKHRILTGTLIWWTDTLKGISRNMPTYISMRFSEDLEFLKSADLVTITVFRKQLLESKRVKTVVILWFWHPIVWSLSEWMGEFSGFWYQFGNSLYTGQIWNVTEVLLVLFSL